MTKAEILARARRAAAESCAKYRLGRGGMDPDARLPEDRDGLLDCSGFVAWCIGQSRKTSDEFLRSVNGGWIETTGIVRDALDDEGMFTKAEVPEPGDLIVYGDLGNGQGHVGIISAVSSGKAEKVIHCSSGASRLRGRAIEESATIPAYFYGRGAIHVAVDAAEDDLTPRVRITATALNVRSAPGASAEKIDLLRRGEIVPVLTERDGWIPVELADGRIGWIASRYTEIA